MRKGKDRERIGKPGRVAATLKEKARGLRGYEVTHVPEENIRSSFRLGSEARIWAPEYEGAIRLKEQLVREFEGKALEKAIPGRVVSNEYGECYHIAGRYPERFKKADNEECRQIIISDLKLVYGIGAVREQKLKWQGYRTICDLRTHPRWQRFANDVLQMIEASDVASLQKWLWRFLPKSHPLVYYLAGFCRDEDFAILDIETLGLFGRAIVLLGIARPENNGIHVDQFLLRDIQDEPSALCEVITHLDESAALITFNGRGFDVPYILQRLAFYGIEASLDRPHFDLLHFTRRAWRDRLPDCRLGTVEEHLGVHRTLDVPSALVPEFYETYLKTRNVGPLVAIVDHNRQDLLTLATLFSQLYKAWNI